MGEDARKPEMSRHTVAEAADMLGISTGAVRNRLSRGTLRSTKEKGKVYVLLYADMSRGAKRDTDDTPGGMPDALADDLREQVRYLRDQLRREQDAHAEARRIIAGLVQRVPELEAPREQTESPQTVEEEPGGTSPRPDAPGPQTGVERRSWWRRLFGG